MKKFLAVILSLAVMSAMIFASFTVAFAEEENDYVTFTVTGSDPYATFKFSEDGNHKEIAPDTVKWAAIRCRNVSEHDSKGAPYMAQLYVSPAAEPCVPFYYEFSGRWDTIVIDLNSVREDSETASIWNSTAYTNLTEVRFDPLEIDKNAERYADTEEYGFVSPGDTIDVAWIAFFEKEEDAKAYTGTEDTAYCILDAASLSRPSGANKLEARRYTDGIPEATPEPDIGGATGTYALYDTDYPTSTGYWVNPLAEGDILSLYFEIPDWFLGISFFAYCAEVETLIDVEIYDDDSNLVWSGREVCLSNALHEISFGKTFAPGWYTVEFVYVLNPELPEDTHLWFVLGSGQERDDLDPSEIKIEGSKGSTSLGAPQIIMFLGEPDPNYVTPEPTEVITPEVTEAPTFTPEPEEVTTEIPTGDLEPKKKGCGTLIGGGTAVLGIALLAAFAMRKKH